MNIVIAIDSFKGSLTSLEAGKAIEEGIRKVDASHNIVVRPLADGGEGTVEALIAGMNGVLKEVEVTSPLGQRISASYGIIKKTNTAVIEMSAVAGITLIRQEQRNPLYTTTYGVGEMICDAVDQGCRNFIIGIGGSATNDGGAGMLQALGFEFLNEKKQQVPFGANGLKELKSISDNNVRNEIKECSFSIACDVTNPLCGPQGCSVVFGPQKGATNTMITQMDTWLSNYAALAKESFKSADPNQPGAGAAGGMGFAFLTFLNARLESGVKRIMEETRLEEYIKNADIVITGEGKLDGQSMKGKAPIGVAKLAKKYNKKVIAFAGCVEEDAVLCNQHGIDAFFPILRCVVSLEEAMDSKNATKNLIATVQQVFLLLQTV